MPRYVTPSKICLLILTHLYCRGQFSRAGILTILKLLTGPVLAANSTSEATSLQTQSIRAKSFVDLARWKAELQTLDVPVKLQKKYQNVWMVLVDRLSMIDNVDRLFNLIKYDLEEMLLNKEDSTLAYTLSRASVLGIFVRRAKLEFERIQFQEAISCFIQFRRFLFDSFSRDEQLSLDISYLTIRENTSYGLEFNLSQGSKIQEVLQQNLDDPEPVDANLSTTDVEAVLEFQVEQMQKSSLRLPEEVRDYYRRLLTRSAQSISLSYYRSFLDAWYSGDYSTAFESLHRYYDYAAHHKDRAHYQYALLNMAILQSDMSSIKEALDALNECISVAKENKDVTCLNFALGWLYHFQSSHVLDAAEFPEGMALENKTAALNFLKSKAQEGKMWRTLSSTLLNEAMLYLQQGKPPVVAFDPLYKASHLNIQYNLADVKPAHLLISSSLLRRLGLTTLANIYVTEIAASYSYDASAEDTLRAIWALARSDMARGDCEVALTKLNGIDMSPIANRRLENLRQVSVLMMQLVAAIRRAEVYEAGKLLSKLKTVMDWSKDLQFEIQMLEFDYMCMIEAYTEAHNLLGDIDRQLARYDGDTYHRATLLLRKARLFVLIGRPENGFSLIIRCTILAFRTKTFPVLHEAAAVMSLILSNMREFPFALKVAEAVVYQAEEVQDGVASAHIYSALVDAHMGLFGQPKPLSPKKLEHLRNATHWASKAFNVYKSMSDVTNMKEFRSKLEVIIFERMQYPDDLRRGASGDAAIDEIVEELRLLLDD